MGQMFYINEKHLMLWTNGGYFAGGRVECWVVFGGDKGTDVLVVDAVISL